jgi:hypothetical protein
MANPGTIKYTEAEVGRDYADWQRSGTATCPMLAGCSVIDQRIAQCMFSCREVDVLYYYILLLLDFNREV